VARVARGLAEGDVSGPSVGQGQKRHQRHHSEKINVRSHRYAHANHGCFLNRNRSDSIGKEKEAKQEETLNFSAVLEEVNVLG